VTSNSAKIFLNIPVCLVAGKDARNGKNTKINIKSITNKIQHRMSMLGTKRTDLKWKRLNLKNDSLIGEKQP